MATRKTRAAIKASQEQYAKYLAAQAETIGTRFAEVVATYQGSDGEATKRLYAELEALGPAGLVAMNLFRACKCSERAKAYRGGNGHGSYRAQAYERKQWSIENLSKILTSQAAGLGIVWGWNVDPKEPVHRHVLYVDLPAGQVSFHTDVKCEGPQYEKRWDGVVGSAPERICRYLHDLLPPVLESNAPGA